MADYAECAGNSGDLTAVLKQWDDIPVREQREVLIALSCQLRAARRLALQHAPARAAALGEPSDACLCAIAGPALRLLVSGAPGTWALPPCAGCRRGIVAVMCALQYGYYAALGFTGGMIIAQADLAAGY